MNEKVRIAIIGIGNMGREHFRILEAGQVVNAELRAVCDLRPEYLEWARERAAISCYSSLEELWQNKAEMDAVIVATPHYAHPDISIAALEQGLHVMCEKPVGVYTKAVRRLNALAQNSDAAFGIMYNQRTIPLYQKLRDLVQGGELGALKRINWMITDWYRPQSYYDSGSWRATWKGEGGGVLINQCPHQLDLWQWIFGLPQRVRSFCGFGKMHEIEVEDDVTAYMEYACGATGVLIASTGDAPGTNRLEVSADRGKLVIEHGKMTFYRNRVPEREFNAKYRGGFGAPECWKCEIPVQNTGTEHAGILNNWVTAIRDGAELLSPGVEGIIGLSLSNSIHLSSWIDDWVELPLSPLDEDKFYQLLQERIARSDYSADSSKRGSTVLEVRGTH